MSITLTMGLIGLPTAATADAPEVPVAQSELRGLGDPAAKKRAPKLAMSKKRSRSVTRPFPLESTIQLPVLTGSTKKNRKQVQRLAKKAIAAQTKILGEWRADCHETPAYPARLTVEGGATSVHAGRYASIALVFHQSTGCSGTMYSSSRVRSFTLDLKTGRKVKLSRFAAPKHPVTKLAVVSALRRADTECTWVDLTAWDTLPALTRWTVSKRGVRFWFGTEEVGPKWCGVVSALVPSRELAIRNETKGKTFNRVYVRNFSRAPDGYISSEFKVLSTRGREVAVVQTVTDAGEGRCERGLRRGKTATLYRYGQWNHGEARWTGHAERVSVRLKGKRSKPRLVTADGWKLATKAQVQGIFQQHGIPLDAYEYCTFPGSNQILDSVGKRP